MLIHSTQWEVLPGACCLYLPTVKVHSDLSSASDNDLEYCKTKVSIPPIKVWANQPRSRFLSHQYTGYNTPDWCAVSASKHFIISMGQQFDMCLICLFTSQLSFGWKHNSLTALILNAPFNTRQELNLVTNWSGFKRLDQVWNTPCSRSSGPAYLEQRLKQTL